MWDKSMELGSCKNDGIIRFLLLSFLLATKKEEPINYLIPHGKLKESASNKSPR